MRRLTWCGILCLIMAPAAAGAESPVSGPLDVEEAVRIALRNNAGIKQSDAAVAGAAAGRTNALAGLLPSASGTFTFGKSVSSSTVFDLPARVDANGDVLQIADFDLESDQRTTNLSLSISENVGLSRYFSWRASGEALTSAHHARDEASQLLAYNVRSQFYLALRAEALLEVQQQDFDLANEQLRRTQTMFELGSVARADVLKAQVRLSEAELSLIRQRNTVEIEQARLATLIGYPASTRFDLAGELSGAAAAVDSAGVVRDARERPDLNRARAEVRGARLEHRAAVTSRVPSLFATFSTGATSGQVTSDQLDQSFNPSDNVFELVKRREEGDIQSDNWSVRMGATVSLDAFLNVGGDRAARAGLRRAEYGLENLELAAQQEIEEAVLNHRAAVLAIASAERGVEAAEEDVRLSRERYEQGLGTILELLEAQVNLTRARYTRVDARTVLQIAEANLARVRGTPVER